MNGYLIFVGEFHFFLFEKKKPKNNPDIKMKIELSKHDNKQLKATNLIDLTNELKQDVGWDSI